MTSRDNGRNLLKRLPAVDSMLVRARSLPQFHDTPRPLLVEAIRETIDDVRKILLSNESAADTNDFSEDRLMAAIEKNLARKTAPNLLRVVNGTGVIVHTNLGRSLLAEEAMAQIQHIAGSYSNLEFDLGTGHRGSRYSLVENLLCKLTGAEAAMVVNNNAAAVLLCLDTVARNKEVVVSRGELVEIGGSFRIPEVMAKSGAHLREVGATNRTHLKDYHGAIGSDTGLLLKVHTSNFHMIGFTASVELKDLVQLGHRFHIPVMEDLGSGTLIDLSKHGLRMEPTAQASVAAGADLVTFSGDKLLGGPQAGIILGGKELLRQIKENPLTRALRIDKLTLAGLEGTLRLYLDDKKAVTRIPTLGMLTLSQTQVAEKARRLADLLGEIGDSRLDIRILKRHGKAGGGALPMLELPGECLAIDVEGFSAAAFEKAMRASAPPVIGRIESDAFLLDPRTIKDEEFILIKTALERILNPE